MTQDEWEQNKRIWAMLDGLGRPGGLEHETIRAIWPLLVELDQWRQENGPTTGKTPSPSPS